MSADKRTNYEYLLKQHLHGQDHVIDRIVPYLRTYDAGLSPATRPAGIFLLLGPTGVGKTATVEALAQVLHGSRKSMIKIDCGDMIHDGGAAKLVGSPPGYLGHRETHPMLSEVRLKAATSDTSDLSLVLFDEIEKCPSALEHLLLGILDRGELRLATNDLVNFQKSIVFLTSNLGARDLEKLGQKAMGFDDRNRTTFSKDHGKREAIAINAARRRFMPEFCNRIDEMICYSELTTAALQGVITNLTSDFNSLFAERYTGNSAVLLTEGMRTSMLAKADTKRYGARDLGRIFQREVAQRVADKLTTDLIPANAHVVVDVDADNRTFVSVSEYVAAA